MSSAEKASITPSPHLQQAWAEGLAGGPSQPFEIEEIKRLARERFRKLAAMRDVKTRL